MVEIASFCVYIIFQLGLAYDKWEDNFMLPHVKMSGHLNCIGCKANSSKKMGEANEMKYGERGE